MKDNMEHSQFIEDYGLPIIGALIFLFGILVGMNLCSYILRRDNQVLIEQDDDNEI